MLGALLVLIRTNGLIYTSRISITTNQAGVTTLYASGKVGDWHDKSGHAAVGEQRPALFRQ
jgi:hypothetical protein